jgi:uncharacterized protein with ATP-grasp and redox domains
MRLDSYQFIYPTPRYPFAYFTLTQRLPKILNDVVQSGLFTEHSINANLIHLAKGIEHHVIEPIPMEEEESPYWTEFFNTYVGKLITEVPFFLAEVYFYRHLLAVTHYNENRIDPFQLSKKNEIESSVVQYQNFISKRNEFGLKEFIMASLLGNKADLSQFVKYSDTVTTSLIINESEALINKLKQRPDVHIILDNAGTELFYDLQLAEYLSNSVQCGTVFLYPKSSPIFVSDALEEDITILLEHIKKKGKESFSKNLELAILHRRIVVDSNVYWSSPQFFTNLPNSFLHRVKSEDLVISKGDANYRRFFEDRDIVPTTKLSDLNLQFDRTFFALRTLKSELLVGADYETVERLCTTDPQWMVNGNYSIIQKI